MLDESWKNLSVNPAKALAPLGSASTPKPADSKIRRVLGERMTLSEGIDAANAIIGRYPNGGAAAGASYIGAIAAMLGSYPRQVAMRCADKINGVVRECKFLPTVADIVGWCEREVVPLYKHAEREVRVAAQLTDRTAYEKTETVERLTRLSLEQLKEKYGDWNDVWRHPGTKERELREKSRADLIGQIGEDAFDKLPDAPPRV